MVKRYTIFATRSNQCPLREVHAKELRLAYGHLTYSASTQKQCRVSDPVSDDREESGQRSEQCTGSCGDARKYHEPQPNETLGE